MRYLHILCEGQTEEAVARDVIAPYFDPLSVQVSYSIYTTKRPAGGPAFKGGLSRWPKLERELRLLLRNSSTTVLTTMFEAWVLADCVRLGDLMGDPRPAEELARVVRQQAGPELVNDGPDTAPSSGS